MECFPNCTLCGMECNKEMEDGFYRVRDVRHWICPECWAENEYDVTIPIPDETHTWEEPSPSVEG